ncbi:YcaO-like family protein [Streptomyces sp. NPDC087908]|uniref:YcaO-like family protein n=1 Tax=Streptomyces sp. NPDC087908 TaxID=3365820 RepID=UPI00383054A3
MTGHHELPGTFRACPAAETWRRIRPFFATAGITRVADITRLDHIGIPVFTAVRPNGKTLSVSQGKGATPELARVSAAMEALEVWHMEEFAEPVSTRPFRDLRAALAYPLGALPQPRLGALNDLTPLEWQPARDLLSGEETYVPDGCVRLDFSRPENYAPQFFFSTSTGVASGNTLAEATLHALHEILERHYVAVSATGEHPWWWLDVENVRKSASRAALNRFTDAGISVVVRFCGLPGELPVFEAFIWGDDIPHVFMGAGCHVNADVALSRALHEAAQSRLTMISGVRDDLYETSYQPVESNPFPRWLAATRSHARPPEGTIDMDGFTWESIDHALSAVTRIAARESGYAPLRVDATRPGVGIPVIRVIVPGLKERRR